MGKNKNKKKIKKNKSHDHNNDTNAISETDEIVTHDTDSVEINLENLESKRKLEDDSSSGHEVKRKKKKRQIIPEEPTGKSKKKSIRQMKREKFAQRQAEAAAAGKDQQKSQCITYLSQWKHDRQNWKFMKVKQAWLFKNKFSTDLVPESFWPILLEYFESAQGNIRKLLLDDANKIIQQMDDWTESQGKEETLDEKEKDEEEHENDQEITKPSNGVYNRARSLIQCLQE